MGLQQVTKIAESLVTKGVKKLKYVTPTCRVGTAEELGLSCEKLAEDVLNKSSYAKIYNKSLNELCTTHYIDGNEMAKLFAKFPDLNPHIGLYPSSFFKYIKAPEIISKRKDLTSILDNYALKMGSTSIKEDELKYLTQSLQDQLSKTLNSNITIKQISRGSWGSCYKLSINDKNYALKIFDDCGYGNPIHGPSVEPGLANLLNCISNKCAKFFYGKIGVENNRGAYTISEFLEGNIPNGISKDNKALREYFWNINLSNNPNIKIVPMDFKYDNLPKGGKFFDFGFLQVDVLNEQEKNFIFHA